MKTFAGSGCGAALWLAAAAASLALPGAAFAQSAVAQPVPANARGCKSQGEPSTYLGNRRFHLRDTRGGGTDYSVSALQFTCNNNTFTYYYRYGVRGAPAGHGDPAQVLVPERYDDVAPFSHSLFMVKRPGGPWVMYRAGKGETGPALPYTDVVALRSIEACQRSEVTASDYSPTVFAALTAPGADGRRDAVIYTGDEQPVTIPGLGGPGVDKPIERHRNLLIGRWKDPDGAVRHRLYSTGGRPLSPVLGAVTRWATVMRPGVRRLNLPCLNTDSVELLVVGPSLDQDPTAGFWGPLYTPIGADGAPIPLPPGALGVIPVPFYIHDTAPTPELGLFGPYRQTRVWSVIFPSPQGFTFTLHEGPLADAVAAAPTAQRFDNLIRRGDGAPPSAVDPWAIFSRSGPLLAQDAKDRRWYSFQYLRGDIRGVGANPDAAIASLQQAAAADNAAFQAEQQRQQAQLRTDYERKLADGSACNFVPPYNLGRETVARHATLCPHRYNLDDLNRLRGEGYPAAVTAGIQSNQVQQQQREEAYRAEQAELARSYVPPGAWQAAVRAASDQQVRDIQQSTQNWLTQRQAQHNADWQRSQRAY